MVDSWSLLAEERNIDGLMLGIEKYKKREVSLGKVSELEGLSIAEMINKLSEYGVKSNLSFEDYEAGYKSLKKIW